MTAWTINAASRPAPDQLGSTVGRLKREVIGDLSLPAIAVRQQLFLIVEEFFVRLGGELEVRPLDDRINWARLLTIAAIDAFRHIDVVSRRAPTAILPGLGLDRDCKRRANRFAQLAGDAALLAVGIAPE